MICMYFREGSLQIFICFCSGFLGKTSNADVCCSVIFECYLKILINTRIDTNILTASAKSYKVSNKRLWYDNFSSLQIQTAIRGQGRLQKNPTAKVSSSELPNFTQMQTKIRQLTTHLQQRQHHMISVAFLHLVCFQSAFSVQKVGLNLEGPTVPSGFILRPEFLLEFICCSFVCVKFTSA